MGSKPNRTLNTECSFCGVPLYRPRGKYKRSFCKECNSEGRRLIAHEMHEIRYRKYIERWLAGDENGMKGKTSTSRHIIRWLREEYNNRCSRCGWGEINPRTWNVPVEAEHIDGNFRNNRPENLDLICPNCHSLTGTYRSLNKGKGRPRD